LQVKIAGKPARRGYPVRCRYFARRLCGPDFSMPNDEIWNFATFLKLEQANDRRILSRIDAF
jgi:hypothetical protein